MSTPGKAKALRSLAKAKKKNVDRLAAGKKPVIGGKTVHPETFRKKTGMTPAKAKAIKKAR